MFHISFVHPAIKAVTRVAQTSGSLTLRRLASPTGATLERHGVRAQLSEPQPQTHHHTHTHTHHHTHHTPHPHPTHTPHTPPHTPPPPPRPTGTGKGQGWGSGKATESSTSPSGRCGALLLRRRRVTAAERPAPLVEVRRQAWVAAPLHPAEDLQTIVRRSWGWVKSWRGSCRCCFPRTLRK